MSFSELYGAVLSPFVKKFKLAKNENEKKAIVKSASAAVSSKKELLEEGGDDLPEDLQAVCGLSILIFSLMMFMCSGYNSIYERCHKEGI